jgi:hypothetical protein
MRVLITAPSLDEHDNVSGISTMISNIIDRGGRDFIHFKAGRKDDEGFGVNWIVSQMKLPFAFRRALANAKADLVHINTAFEPRSMIRDLVLARSTKQPVVLHVHGGRYVMRAIRDAGVSESGPAVGRRCTTSIGGARHCSG